MPCDPRMSEWGNPAAAMPPHRGARWRRRSGDICISDDCDDQETCQAGARRGGASAAQRREPRASLLILCQIHRDRTPCGVTDAGPAVAQGLLSRKEVFQPHLPVRLPCYDLAPVTTFALGGSSPTSGARGSHGLTGGVYKARERIHRAMADARLLAIPASRSRVADSDPDCDRLSGSAPCHQVAPLCAGHCSTCVAPDVRAVLI